MVDYILQTRKEIREKTAYFFSFNLFLFVFLLVELKILSNDPIQNLSLLSSIFAAGFSILVFLGDFYRFLEKVLTGKIFEWILFKRLEKVFIGRIFVGIFKRLWIFKKCFKYTSFSISEYIVENLTTPCEKCIFDHKEDGKLKQEDFSRVMSLFYKFIPPDHTERERSFAYFTDYYIAINYFVISASFLILSGIVIKRRLETINPMTLKTANPVALLILIVYLVIFLFSLGLCRRYSGKLIYPTKSQIQEILTTKRDELISLLPRYRVYKIYIDNNGRRRILTCAETKKCPLIMKKSDYHDIF